MRLSLANCFLGSLQLIAAFAETLVQLFTGIGEFLAALGDFGLLALEFLNAAVEFAALPVGLALAAIEFFLLLPQPI